MSKTAYETVLEEAILLAENECELSRGNRAAVGPLIQSARRSLENRWGILPAFYQLSKGVATLSPWGQVIGQRIQGYFQSPSTKRVLDIYWNFCGPMCEDTVCAIQYWLDSDPVLPESKCIASDSSFQRSLCGETPLFRWMFMDATQARAAYRKGSRFYPCPICLRVSERQC